MTGKERLRLLYRQSKKEFLRVESCSQLTGLRINCKYLIHSSKTEVSYHNFRSHLAFGSIDPYITHKNGELVQLLKIQGLKGWLRMTPVQDVECCGGSRGGEHSSGQNGDRCYLLCGRVLITGNLEITS